jgi:hypothetical protein
LFEAYRRSPAALSATFGRKENNVERYALLSPFYFVVPVLFGALAGCAPGNPHQVMGDFGVVSLQRACLSGKVTDAVTGRGLNGVLLQIDPAVAGLPIRTNRDGFYYVEFPGGARHIRFVREGYRAAELTVELKRGATAGRDVSLDPFPPVIVDAGSAVTGVLPGATVTVSARVTARDGSRVKGVHWSTHPEEGEVTAILADADTAVVRVTLPGTEAYREALLYRLGGDARLLDRFMVVGLGPSDLLWAGRVPLLVTVTTTSGSYTDTVDIVADLRSFAEMNPGLRNVPIGRTIFLQGKKRPAYAWSLASPAGSAAALKEAATQNPSFVPDVPGTYTIREGGRERLTIVAGTWNGALAAWETETRPRWIGAKGCMCHFNNSVTPKFTAWRRSGHAEIFTRCVTTVFRYEERCFTCHTVGFGGKTTGISSAPAYPTFLHDANLWDLGKTPPVFVPRPGNLATLIETYPEVARQANVQCENCHGPNNSTAHKTLKKGAPERISLDSHVCGTCHDETVAEEPSLRQWLTDKKHSNYNRALEVATVDRKGEEAADCGRCHAAQGFLAWIAKGDRSAELAPRNAAGREHLSALGLTGETVHPVTCAVCHDPHNPGSTFRSETEKVPVRKVESARMHPAEFGSDGGRGAICITCHSTIWGAYNDATYPRVEGDLVPHAGQSDVLFGQNAFFIEPGAYRSHARIEDTCVWCHVKPVPKPGLGYPIRGANHTFQANAEICGKCHDFAGDELMDAVEREMEELKVEIEDALFRGIGRKGSVRFERYGAGGAPLSIATSLLQKPQLVESERKPALETATAGGKYTVPLDHVSPGGEPLLDTDAGQVAAKAAWNYFLIKKDGSKGAHNPQFVREVIHATSEKVRELWR